MDSFEQILSDARRQRENALGLLAQAEAGGYLPIGVTIDDLRHSIGDYDEIIKRLGWRDNA